MGVRESCGGVCGSGRAGRPRRCRVGSARFTRGQPRGGGLSRSILVLCAGVEGEGAGGVPGDKEGEGGSIRVGFSGGDAPGQQVQPPASSSGSLGGVAPMTEAEQKKAQTLKVVTGALSLAVAALYLGLVQIMDARTQLFGFVPMDVESTRQTPAGGEGGIGETAPGLQDDACERYPGC